MAATSLFEEIYQNMEEELQVRYEALKKVLGFGFPEGRRTAGHTVPRGSRAVSLCVDSPTTFPA